MNIKEIRQIIKDNNFNVKIEGRTNSIYYATSFDVDDFDALNEILQKNCNQKFKGDFVGTKFERYYFIGA